MAIFKAKNIVPDILTMDIARWTTDLNSENYLTKSCKFLQHFSIKDIIQYLQSTFMMQLQSEAEVKMKLRSVMQPFTVHTAQ